MKIQVLHDKAGKIHSVFAPAAGGRKGGIEAPNADMTVIEIDVPDAALASAGDQPDRVAASLSKLVQDYEVRAGRLLERSGK